MRFWKWRFEADDLKAIPKHRLHLFLVAIAVISIPWILLSYAISCDREITSTVSNDRGDRILVQYNLSCAALAGSTNLAVLHSRFQIYLFQIYLFDFFEPFLITEYDYSQLITARWNDGKNISVTVPKDFTVYRKDTHANDIGVQYE